MVCFVVQRGDCSSFAPNAEQDPLFANILHDAMAKGVTVKVVYTSVTRDGIFLESIGNYVHL